MEDSDKSNEAHNHGPGQAVNVVFTNGNVRWFVIGLLALIALLIWTDRTSSRAELKANQAIKASEDAQTEFRLSQIWAQRVNASCEQSGVKLPPLPASMAN